MGNLFLNLPGDLKIVANEVYKSLGIEVFEEGTSTNVLNETYYSFNIFGCKILLEYNSYDYEDDYKYMLSVEEDFLSPFQVGKSIIGPLTLIVGTLLYENLKIEIAIEEGDQLKILKDI